MTVDRSAERRTSQTCLAYRYNCPSVSARRTAPVTPDRYAGCLLGLALGDALGAPYEGGPQERALWKLLGKTRNGESRWTDDTRMALDLAQSLVDANGLDQDLLATRFAASYRWSRGYGPGAARLLKRIRRGQDWRKANRAIFPDGSYGNGAAMRAPVIGLYYANRADEFNAAVAMSAEVTHAHPLAIEGALLIATATKRAVAGASGPEVLSVAASSCVHEGFQSRLSSAESWIRDGNLPEPDEVVGVLGNGIAAVESCVTATYIGVRHLNRSFEEMLEFAIRCKGDVDTIAAMAGAIWGAANGAAALPEKCWLQLEQADRLRDAALALHERAFAP